MPYCTNCGQEISQEDFLYFDGECIDCVHGIEVEYNLKLTSCFLIGFFGLIFLISSSLMVSCFIVDSFYMARIMTISQISGIAIFHGISIIMIVLAIKKYKTIRYRRTLL
ncbi:MAG: hypothetical protein ACFFBH_15640 [Promethearchaeota archaeon]